MRPATSAFASNPTRTHRKASRTQFSLVLPVEHATMIDDEGIALAKQHGTYLDMDIYDEECIQADKNTPKDFLQHDTALGQIQRDNFRKAVQAGVKMSFGTDAVSALTAPARSSLPSW